MEVKATKVFEKNLISYRSNRWRIIVNEGGTGSGKTYALCQLFIYILHTEKGRRLTICRKTLPALRATAMRDFFSILKQMNLYREEWHNKSQLTYTCKITGSEVEFISIDEPTKVRSRRRDYLWINEATELTYEDFQQLNMRTEKKIFLDYNPSYVRHWIYDNILVRVDTRVIKSTYRDNPFLAEDVIREIERYKETDENLWRVFGLGERAVLEDLIYPRYEVVDAFPEIDFWYGLDFGYTNPTAMVRVGILERDLYVDEILYQSYLTTSELIEFLKQNIDRKRVIYADPSRPEVIDEIKRAGFWIDRANNDVFSGINRVKKYNLKITKKSVNLQKEINNYGWKRNKMGELIEIPEKLNDHLMDAMRYALTVETGGGYKIGTYHRKFVSDIMV